MEGAPFQPWTGGAGEEAPVKRERDERPLDAGRLASLQRVVESSLGAESRQRVAVLLEQTELLTALEKLLFYLKLPAGPSASDPLKQPLNALGSRSEIQQTVTWIQTHLEVDTEVSLPKQDVYDEYIAFCMSSSMKPLSTADFGKVMKQVYPQVRPRRLGTRGNSRYCYAGLRKRVKLEVPPLPDLFEKPSSSGSSTGATTAPPEPSGGAGGSANVDSGTARLLCDWAESILGVKVQSLPELAAHLQQTPAPVAPPPPPPAARAAPPQPSPVHHLPSHLTENPEGMLSGDPGGTAAGARHPRQLLGQLKRKIQLQATSTPKKNKSLEAPDIPPLGPVLPVKQPHPHESERTSAYPYPGGYHPSYEPRTPYIAYPGVPIHPHAPMYRESYRLQSPYHTAGHSSLPPEAPYPAHLPINLSSDASTSYPPTLDLSPPTRHEWPQDRPPDPPHPPQQTHAPAKLPLPGKKMILEAYHNEQSNSPRSQAARAPLPDQPHLYLPKKMRATESLGGKLAAARHAAALAEQQPPPPAVPLQVPPPTERRTPPEESLANYEQRFLEGPKNLAGRSKSIAAALVRTEGQTETTPTRPTARGRPRRRSPGGRGRGRGRRRRASAPRAPTPDSCCGLDGINLKTGIICKENHSEIMNRERVSSICSMDKHALDDYLNEGSSQEHEEELMQYFQRSDSRERNPNSADPTAPETNNEKLSQLRELLAKNLKNQRAGSQNVPACADSSRDKPSDGGATSSGSFKSIAGPNITSTPGGNMTTHQVPENTHNEQSGFDKRHSQQQAPNRMPGGPNCEFEEIPGSPSARMQQYDFVPISPSRRSPGHPSASPIKRLATTDPGAPVRSPLSQSTQASPFVSPRDTPVPRSRLHPKPLPDKLSRRKNLACGILAVGQESCHRQISFAMPTDQKCVPKSPVYASRAKHLPMSAPPSPNILHSRYKTQFQLNACHVANGNGNGCATLGYGMTNNLMYHEGSNGDCTPHSADPLSNEVSQFFHEPFLYDAEFHDEASFRSQSVPLHKEAGCRPSIRPQYSYNNTPAGSVPPTPVPNEFCDFVSLNETCESISKAGLNSESLDKIYNVLDSGAAANVLDTHRRLNGVLEQQLSSLLPSDHHIDKNQFAHSGAEANEMMKRSNSMELDLSDLVMDKSRYLSSRSVPSTPLPYGGPSGAVLNGASEAHGHYPPSKSVPSTPLLGEERGGVFSYSNRDFLINGNSLEVENGALGGLLELHKPLEEPLGGAEELQDILHEDCMELPQLPTTDLLADLETPDHAYPDL